MKKTLFALLLGLAGVHAIYAGDQPPQYNILVTNNTNDTVTTQAGIFSNLHACHSWDKGPAFCFGCWSPTLTLGPGESGEIFKNTNDGSGCTHNGEVIMVASPGPKIQCSYPYRQGQDNVPNFNIPCSLQGGNEAFIQSGNGYVPIQVQINPNSTSKKSHLTLSAHQDTSTYKGQIQAYQS